MDEIKRVPLLHVGSQEDFNSPIDRRSDYYRQRARIAASSPQPPQPQPVLTLPNVLTFFRVVLVPVLVICWFLDHRLAPSACAGTFLVASLTDWADGYLARKMKITSEFGAFLDPVADKIMVSTALVLLAATPPEPLTAQQVAVPVALIIGREITMSALREWAAASGGGAHKAVKVNSLGKWKTALQMIGLSMLLCFRRADLLFGPSPKALERIALGLYVSLGILWAGVVLALWSLANYLSSVWSFFRYPSGKPPKLPRTSFNVPIAKQS